MFENLLGQPASLQIVEDLSKGVLPQALLFAGPQACGKGTAALELARVLSCQTALMDGDPSIRRAPLKHGRADWNCPCSACERHRLLEHPDLLMMGRRDFSSELKASAESWKRERSGAVRFLFKRALGKLLARFSPILWEGEEQKLGKAAGLLADISELSEDLDRASTGDDNEAFAKLLDKVLGLALKLEADALPSTLPVSWIRNASFWAHSTPFGRHKTIIIEDLDRLQEGSRNALLKILEEPPETCTLILSTTRRHAVMETLLSRLRTYRFQPRSIEDEAAVVRRVFRDTASADSPRFSGLSNWLEGFMPVPPELLRALAASFVLAIFDEFMLHAPQRRGELGPLAEFLAQSWGPSISSMGLDTPTSPRMASQLVLERSAKFEPRTVYSRFLAAVLDCLRPALREAMAPGSTLSIAQRWKDIVRSSESAVLTYNQSPPQALDALFFDLFSALSQRTSAPGVSTRSQWCVPS